MRAQGVCAWSWQSTSSMHRALTELLRRERTHRRRRRRSQSSAGPSGRAKSPRASSSRSASRARRAGGRRRQGAVGRPGEPRDGEGAAPLRARGPLLRRLAVDGRDPHAAVPPRRLRRRRPGASSCSSRASRPRRGADQLEGLSPERAERRRRELAGLHAPHWGDNVASTAGYVRQDVDDAAAPALRRGPPALFALFLERYGDELDGATRAVVEWLAPRLGAYHADRGSQARCMHGDFRTDNLLFDGRGGEVPMATVDWQMVTTGTGALDVAYLLTTSLDTEDRRRARARAARHATTSGSASSGWLATRAPRCSTTTPSTRSRASRCSCAPRCIVERTERGDAMFLTMIERSRPPSTTSTLAGCWSPDAARARRLPRPPGAHVARPRHGRSPQRLRPILVQRLPRGPVRRHRDGPVPAIAA